MQIKNTNLSFIPYISIILFFLGGITFSTNSGGIYLPFILILIIPVLLPTLNSIRPTNIFISYILLTASILVSCVFLIPEGLTNRKLGGLVIIFFGWLGLLLGRKFSHLKNNVLLVGGYTLILQILISFLINIKSLGISTNEVINFIFNTKDLGNYYQLKQNLDTLFGNSNYLAAFMLFFFGYSLYKNNLIHVLFSLFAILLTLSRTAFIIAIAAFVIFKIKKILKKQPQGINNYKPFLLLIILATVPVALLFIYTLSESFFNNVNQATLRNITTLSSRTLLWQTTWEFIMERPLIGYGYGFLKEEIDKWSVHNGILDYWLSYGLFSALSIMFYIIHIIRKAYILTKYSFKREEYYTIRGVLLGLYLMIVHSMVEPLLLDSKFLMFIGIIAGGLEPQKRSISNFSGDRING